MKHTHLLLIFAKTFARQRHGDQMYGAMEYFYHLDQVDNKVAMILGEDACLFRIVAILHDVLEDTDATTGELEYFFGKTVADAVWAMTKIDDEDYYDYIARVRANSIALFVKKCDTMCNLEQSFKEQRHKGIIKYTTQLQLLEAK